MADVEGRAVAVGGIVRGIGVAALAQARHVFFRPQDGGDDELVDRELLALQGVVERLGDMVQLAGGIRVFFCLTL